MFKYIKYNKVKTDTTVLEFRGANDKVEVNHFDVDVVSLSGEEVDINTLIASQPSEINCIFITQEEFKSIVVNTTQFERIKKQVEIKFSNDVRQITALYPKEERETWSTQLYQAELFKTSGNEVDAPFLKILADAEGDTVLESADVVIAKASQYEMFMANALVDKRAFERELLNKIGL